MERCFLVIAKLKMKVYCHFNYNIFMWWCNQWSIKSFENKFFQIIQRWRCIHHMPGYCWQLNEMYMQFVVFSIYFQHTFPTKHSRLQQKVCCSCTLRRQKYENPQSTSKTKSISPNDTFFFLCCVCSLPLVFVFVVSCFTPKTKTRSIVFCARKLKRNPSIHNRSIGLKAVSRSEYRTKKNDIAKSVLKT